MAVSLFYTKANQYMYPAYQDFVVNATGLTTYFFDAAINQWVTTINPKFTLRIKINDADAVILKTPPDINEKGKFFIDKIFQDYLETDLRSKFTESNVDPVSIHKTQGFAENQSTLLKVELIVGEEYTIGDTFYSFEYPVQSGTGKVDTEFFVFNGVAQVETGELFDNFVYEMDGDGKPLTEFNTTNFSTTSLLSTYHNKVRKTDYHTIAMFNRDSPDTANLFSNTIYQVNLTTFEAGFTNSAQYNVTNAFFGNVTMDQNNGLIWFGCGVQNFIDAGVTSAANWNNVTNYKLLFSQNSGATRAAEDLYFEIQEDDCKGFETIRLGWVNTLGAWDYYNFTKRSTKTSTSNRTTFEQDYGYNQTPNVNAWDYLPTQGGTKVLTNTVFEEIEANTNFETEEMAVIFKTLFTSPNVHMQLADGTWVGVVVNEKEYLKQTSANDKLIQYVLTIQKSHNYKVQRS